jgi:carbamoylphosphate synthase small subunit
MTHYRLHFWPAFGAFYYRVMPRDSKFKSVSGWMELQERLQYLDPSYRGQILVFTTPLIGNYGVPHNIAPRDSRDVGVVLESSNVQCAAVVVAM